MGQVSQHTGLHRRMCRMRYPTGQVETLEIHIMQQLGTILWRFAQVKATYLTCLSCRRMDLPLRAKAAAPSEGLCCLHPRGGRCLHPDGAPEETGCSRSLNCRNHPDLSPVAQTGSRPAQMEELLLDHAWKVRSHLRVLRRTTEHWEWW